MKTHSKQKGSKFERDISKLLSKWWSKNERSDLFWRTINSGAMFTNNKKNNFLNEVSDIKSIDENSKLFTDIFNIECKFYKEIDLWNVINRNGDIIKWLDKLLDECILTEKYPLLIVKQNNKPILVFTNEEIEKELIIYFGLKPRLDFIYNDSYISVYLLDDILNLNIDIFKEMLNKIIGKERYE